MAKDRQSKDKGSAGSGSSESSPSIGTSTNDLVVKAQENLILAIGLRRTPELASYHVEISKAMSLAAIAQILLGLDEDMRAERL